MDSGAKVTVVSEHLPWVKGQKLDTNTPTLYGPGRIKLPVLGKFQATLQHNGNKLREDIYVIRHQECSLLHVQIPPRGVPSQLRSGNVLRRVATLVLRNGGTLQPLPRSYCVGTRHRGAMLQRSHAVTL